MKMQVKLWMAICAIAAVAACSKNDQSGTTTIPEEPVPGERVTIRAGIPDALSKVSLNPESDPDGGLLLAWEATDKIRVISSSGNEVFDIDTFDGHEATFTGNAVSGSSFDILYPGTYADVAEAETGVSNFLVQTQAGNASSAHLQYTALLSGVDSYEDVLFTEAWATEHGGSLKQSGALRVRFQLPDAAATVAEATASVGGRSVKVVFDGNADISADHILTFYANLPWEAFTLGEEDVIEVKVVTADHDVYHKSFTPTGKTFEPGQLNAVKLSRADVILEDFAGGSGVDGDPWLIGNKRQMQNIAANLETGETKYFKLIEDIDMTDVSWASLNNANPYTKKIDFDGNNKTISHLSCNSSYPAFIGILVGAVKDLTIDQATITAGTNRGGIFANYIGHSSAGPATVTNVHVTNSSVTGTGSTTGGFCSLMQNAGSSVTACTVENTTVSGKGVTGGFVGDIQNGTIGGSEANKCEVKKTGTGTMSVTASAAQAGGFAGLITSGNVSYCDVDGVTVTSTANEAAGFAGRLARGKSVSQCVVTEVSVSGTYNSGGFVGVCYGSATGCSSSGSVVTTGKTGDNANAGGFAGFVQYAAVLSGCHSSASVEGIARNIGGFAGSLQSGDGECPTIERCYATGNVTDNKKDRHVGGLVGYVVSQTTKIENCFATGNVEGNQYVGGLIGNINTTCPVSNCYASGTVTAANGATGGLIGCIAKQEANVSKCVAWNSSVIGTTAAGSWSCAAVVGVAFPTCTLTDNYRRSDMSLTAWWVPDADFQHANVNSTNKLMVKDKSTGDIRATTATGLANNNDNYPQFAYHGKVDATKTLSELARDVLGWDASVWNFPAGDALPTLN